MELDLLADYTGLPLSQSHRLIDFGTAVVDTRETFPPQHVVRVTGTAPYPAMRITLEPRTYIHQPDFWAIEVVGVLPPEPQPPRPTPYTAELELAGPMGTQGIEVVGARRTERIALVAGGNPERPTVRLRGVVRDSGDWPLCGVSVRAVRADRAGAEPAAGVAITTDAEGRYSMTLAGPGRYRVSAQPDGHAGTVTETDVSEDVAGRVDFFVAPAAAPRPMLGQPDVRTGSPAPEHDGHDEPAGGERTAGEPPADAVEGADDTGDGRRRTGGTGARGRRATGRGSGAKG